MKFATFAKLAAVAAACVSSLAHAVPIVYTFTGTTPAANLVSTMSVSGSITIDSSLFTPSSISTTSISNAGSDLLSSSFSIAFGDGTSFSQAANLPGTTVETLTRPLGSSSFGVSTSASSTPSTLSLTITSLGSLFQTSATDVSFGQSVALNGPALSATGTFSYGTVVHAFTITSLTVAPVVAAVPEPETYALMLAGLGAVGFIARRRKHA